MTTTQTPALDAAPKKRFHPAVFLLVVLVAVLAVIGVVLGFMAHYVDDSRAFQATSMQQSLESHGIKADIALAQNVSEGCRYQRDGYPVSTTLVHDYNGKKSSITFMCDKSTGISDFAATPAS
jgi:hypothetical protein